VGAHEAANHRYPFEPRNPIAGSRGQLVFTKDNCVYCNICAKKCPTGALLVNRAQKRNGPLTVAMHHLRLLRGSLFPRNRWLWPRVTAARP